MPRLFDPRTAFLRLEEEVWRRPTSCDALAQAYAAASSRIRPRSGLPDLIYRYPRGRSIDRVPPVPLLEAAV